MREIKSAPGESNWILREQITLSSLTAPPLRWVREWEWEWVRERVRGKEWKLNAHSVSSLPLMMIVHDEVLCTLNCDLRVFLAFLRPNLASNSTFNYCMRFCTSVHLSPLSLIARWFRFSRPRSLALLVFIFFHFYRSSLKFYEATCGRAIKPNYNSTSNKCSQVYLSLLLPSVPFFSVFFSLFFFICLFRCTLMRIHWWMNSEKSAPELLCHLMCKRKRNGKQEERKREEKKHTTE